MARAVKFNYVTLDCVSGTVGGGAPAFPGKSAAQKTRDTTKPQAVDKDGLPPEEDTSITVPVYGFNPLQAQKEIRTGNYYFKKGSYRAAAGRFEEATKWNSGEPEAWLRLGEAQEKLKDHKAATRRLYEIPATRRRFEDRRRDPQETGKAEVIGLLQPHFHRVLLAIVHQRNAIAPVRFPVDRDPRLARSLHDRDVIHRLAIPVMHLEAAPSGGKARLEVQLVHLQPEPEQRFGDQAVHPPRRTGVPGPPAAADMRRQGVNVGRHDVRLHLIGGNCRRRILP